MGRFAPIGLILVFFAGTLLAIDPCEPDLAALNRNAKQAKLKGADLTTAIEAIASFELNEIQRSGQPPSAKAGLAESLQEKVSEVVRRSGLTEKTIQERILIEKQSQVFGQRPKRERAEEGLRREREQLPQPVPQFTFDRVLGEKIYSIDSIAFTADSEGLISGYSGGLIRIWPLESKDSPKLLTGVTENIRSVAASTNGRRIVSGSNDGAVRVWDSSGLQDPIVFSKPGHPIISVAISRNGEFAAAGSINNLAWIWNIDSRRELHEWKHSDWVSSVAISSDNEFVVSAGGDRLIHRRSIETGKPIGEPLVGHSKEVTAVAISLDSKTLASSSKDGTVRRWDLTQERHSQKLEGCSGMVNSVEFSPDGRYILSDAGGFSMKIWDAKTGELVRKIPHNYGDFLGQVTFSPDGKRIAGFRGSEIFLWKSVPPADDE